MVSESIEHSEEGVSVDVVFGGLAVGRRHGLVELIDVGAEGVAAGPQGVVGVGDDPIGDVESGGEIGAVAAAAIELRESHASPGLVADGAAVEVEGESGGSDVSASRRSLADEVGLGEAAVVEGEIIGLRIDEALAENFGA